MKHAVYAVLAAMLLLLAAPLPAQVLPFEVLGLKEGIPQSQVSALAQDREGYLWVGTWGGLARFNGREFRVFRRQDGLHSSRIHEFLLARDGTLWIATVGGLSRWCGHRLERISDPAVSAVRCRALAEDGRQRIWIGTDNGVVVLDSGHYLPLGPGGAAGALVHDILPDREGILVAADNGLWRYAGDALPRAVDMPGGVETGDLRALAATPEGLWLGTNKAGLWLRGANGWENAESPEAAPRAVYRLSLQPSGALYAATGGNGLFVKRQGEQIGRAHV